MMALEKQRQIVERRMLEERRKAVNEFVQEQLERRRNVEERRQG